MRIGPMLVTTSTTGLAAHADVATTSSTSAESARRSAAGENRCQAEKCWTMITMECLRLRLVSFRVAGTQVPRRRS
jgi:hypothetical protein